MEIIMAHGLGSVLGETLVMLAGKLWPYGVAFVCWKVGKAVFVKFKNLQR